MLGIRIQGTGDRDNSGQLDGMEFALCLRVFKKTRKSK
jgi:hypothetical protein